MCKWKVFYGLFTTHRLTYSNNDVILGASLACTRTQYKPTTINIDSHDLFI